MPALRCENIRLCTRRQRLDTRISLLSGAGLAGAQESQSVLDIAELTIGRAEIRLDGDFAGFMTELVGFILGLQQDRGRALSMSLLRVKAP